MRSASSSAVCNNTNRQFSSYRSVSEILMGILIISAEGSSSSKQWFNNLKKNYWWLHFPLEHRFYSVTKDEDFIRQQEGRKCYNWPHDTATNWEPASYEVKTGKKIATCPLSTALPETEFQSGLLLDLCSWLSLSNLQAWRRNTCCLPSFPIPVECRTRLP